MFRGEVHRVLAYSQAVDVLKSFNGLLGEAKLRFEEDPLSGTLFLFLNRSRTIVKVLWWDRTGWCIFGKRLERGRFELSCHEELQELSEREFELLLDGVLRRVRFQRRVGENHGEDDVNENGLRFEN